MRRIVVRLGEPYGEPQVVDVSGVGNEAMRLDIWDSFRKAVAYNWIDGIGSVPAVDRGRVVLPPGIEWGDLRIVAGGIS